MKIHHQGWNETVGVFNCDVTIDTTKRDYQIFFADGTVSQQQTPFSEFIADWDQDNNPYPKTGAFFDFRGSKEFFTPLELASLVLTGYADIPGLRIEDRQERLDDRIRAAERRAKALSEIHQKAQNKDKAPSQITL